jgi:hypothetical protein
MAQRRPLRREHAQYGYAPYKSFIPTQTLPGQIRRAPFAGSRDQRVERWDTRPINGFKGRRAIPKVGDAPGATQVQIDAIEARMNNIHHGLWNAYDNFRVADDAVSAAVAAGGVPTNAERVAAYNANQALLAITANSQAAATIVESMRNNGEMSAYPWPEGAADNYFEDQNNQGEPQRMNAYGDGGVAWDPRMGHSRFAEFYATPGHNGIMDPVTGREIYPARADGPNEKYMALLNRGLDARQIDGFLDELAKTTYDSAIQEGGIYDITTFLGPTPYTTMIKAVTDVATKSSELVRLGLLKIIPIDGISIPIESLSTFRTTREDRGETETTIDTKHSVERGPGARDHIEQIFFAHGVLVDASRALAAQRNRGFDDNKAVLVVIRNILHTVYTYPDHIGRKEFKYAIRKMIYDRPTPDLVMIDDKLVASWVNTAAGALNTSEGLTDIFLASLAYMRQYGRFGETPQVIVPEACSAFNGMEFRNNHQHERYDSEGRVVNTEEKIAASYGFKLVKVTDNVIPYTTVRARAIQTIYGAGGTFSVAERHSYTVPGMSFGQHIIAALDIALNEWKAVAMGPDQAAAVVGQPPPPARDLRALAASALARYHTYFVTDLPDQVDPLGPARRSVLRAMVDTILALLAGFTESQNALNRWPNVGAIFAARTDLMVDPVHGRDPDNLENRAKWYFLRSVEERHSPLGAADEDFLNTAQEAVMNIAAAITAGIARAAVGDAAGMDAMWDIIRGRYDTTIARISKKDKEQDPLNIRGIYVHCSRACIGTTQAGLLKGKDELMRLRMLIPIITEADHPNQHGAKTTTIQAKCGPAQEMYKSCAMIAHAYFLHLNPQIAEGNIKVFAKLSREDFARLGLWLTSPGWAGAAPHANDKYIGRAIGCTFEQMTAYTDALLNEALEKDDGVMSVTIMGLPDACFVPEKIQFETYATANGVGVAGIAADVIAKIRALKQAAMSGHVSQMFNNQKETIGAMMRIPIISPDPPKEHEHVSTTVYADGTTAGALTQTYPRPEMIANPHYIPALTQPRF